MSSEMNPYESHPALSPTEAALLGEYAKLALHLKHLTAATKHLGEQQTLLVRLRLLERKMALVLTLFKASVWGVINEQAALDTPM